ncbi:pseudouridine-5'-phosphatase-like [Stegodyphus dumicola]|uniref:pseudouridine-5'-phosphatase-like n=1 Tax=Stegodyphus dumicola TaxID=202533 RepID=UPI0015B1680A|nr:pseudouridine-5'-phosphatase-like [Stegodyphus dumicola]
MNASSYCADGGNGAMTCRIGHGVITLTQYTVSYNTFHILSGSNYPSPFHGGNMRVLATPSGLFTFSSVSPHTHIFPPCLPYRFLGALYTIRYGKYFALRDISAVIFVQFLSFLDTEKLYTNIGEAIANRYGKTFTWDVKVKCMGKVADDAARTMIEELQLPITIQEYQDACAALSDELFLQTEVLPGVERLVKHLHANSVPIAIATSSKKKTFDLKVTNHKELISMFHHVVCGSNDPEVKQGKPAPDIFQVCASRFDDKPPPEKVLVFEDAPNGVQAAKAAGMQVIMIPDPRMDPEFCNEATLVLPSMECFRPELFGLPPFVE